MKFENMLSECETYWDTSVFEYIKLRDWKNVRRKLDGFWHKIKAVPRNIERSIAFRTYDKYHVVDTGLQPGYYDKDHLMLHACFNLLKDFVEIEEANRELYGNKEELAKVPWWCSSKRYLRKHGHRLGLVSLSCWDNSKPEDVPNGGWSMKVIRRQQKKYKRIRDLYLWWMKDRPIRPEAYEYKQMDLYNKEDEKKLIELMKIRLTLWT